MQSYYTPEIPATIISPHAFSKALHCSGYQTYSDIVNNRAQLQLLDCRNSPLEATTFELTLIRGLLYIESLIVPTNLEHTSLDPPVPPTLSSPLVSFYDEKGDVPVRALTREQQRALWHMRFGHVNH